MSLCHWVLSVSIRPLDYNNDIRAERGKDNSQGYLRHPGHAKCKARIHLRDRTNTETGQGTLFRPFWARATSESTANPTEGGL